jgi:integrase/recombinase XerD
MNALVSDYEFDCLAQGYEYRTIETYVGRVNIFLEWNGSYEADMDNLRDFLVYLRRESYQPQTLNGYFSAISSFYDYLEWHGHIEDNPIPRFRKRYLRKYKHKPLKPVRQLIGIFDMQ